MKLNNRTQLPGAGNVAPINTGIKQMATFETQVRGTTPAPIITPFTVDPMTIDVEFEQQLDAIDGMQPYTWTVVAGALPPGITFSSSGLLEGTPTTPGNYAFTVKVSDNFSKIDTQAASVEIEALPTLLDGLRAFFKFSEATGAGDRVDSEGNSAPAIPTGSIALAGGAAVFDNTQHMAVADNAFIRGSDVSPFTVAVQFSMSDVPEIDGMDELLWALLSKAVGATREYAIELSSSGIIVTYGDGQAGKIWEGTINQVYTVAMVFDPDLAPDATLRVYIDDSETWTGANVTDYTPGAGALLFGNDADTDNGFKGKIFFAGFWNAALNPDLIAELHANGEAFLG